MLRSMLGMHARGSAERQHIWRRQQMAGGRRGSMRAGQHLGAAAADVVDPCRARVAVACVERHHCCKPSDRVQRPANVHEPELSHINLLQCSDCLATGNDQSSVTMLLHFIHHLSLHVCQNKSDGMQVAGADTRSSMS